MRLIISALILGACGFVLPASSDENSTPQTKSANCVTFFSTPELLEEMSRDSITPDTVCTCIDATFEDAELLDTLDRFFARVVERAETTDQSILEVAGQLTSPPASGKARESGEDAEFSGVPAIFNRLNTEMLPGIQENGGACPAA